MIVLALLVAAANATVVAVLTVALVDYGIDHDWPPAVVLTACFMLAYGLTVPTAMATCYAIC